MHNETAPHRRAYPRDVGARGALGAALGLAIVLGSACTPPTQRARAPVPAAEVDSEVRPFTPPLELSGSAYADAVVRLVGGVSCSGVLIAEDLVLTAHHCVSARDEDGRAKGKDRPARELSVELGGDYLPWGEVSVRAIVSPDCGYTAGDGDIAILVLDRKLIGMPTVNPRLDRPVGRGEAINLLGFGRCAASGDAIRREARETGPIDAVHAGQFVSRASICPGDSGGPVLVGQIEGGSAEIVGVISSSIMDGDQRTSGPSYYTRLDGWEALFSAAREIADGASPSELPPFRSCSGEDP